MIQIKSKTISPAALSAFLCTGNNRELLDVRMPSEYANAHVPGATLIPLNELRIDVYLAQHKPGTPIYVLCQAGARAAKAIEQFERSGCDDCILVEGGTQAWIDAGLPVHRGARNVLPLMRQVQVAVGSLTAIGSILTLAVNPWFAVVPLFLGCGLVFSGITGTCGMALMLAKMPWNHGQNSCSHCCNPE
ncbi:MAG: rhodanese-like domain-containing protein [Terracidiphilus sp.]|jgi:rhodanese-related sulfurtransferase